MYLEIATEENKKMAENWKADADGYPYILCFPPTQLNGHRLVYTDASLISVSIQDI